MPLLGLIPTTFFPGWQSYKTYLFFIAAIYFSFGGDLSHPRKIYSVVYIWERPSVTLDLKFFAIDFDKPFDRVVNWFGAHNLERCEVGGSNREIHVHLRSCTCGHSVECCTRFIADIPLSHLR